jgi:hypothetical protein
LPARAAAILMFSSPIRFKTFACMPHESRVQTKAHSGSDKPRSPITRLGPTKQPCHPTRSNHHKASASGRSSPWPVLKLGGDPKDCQVVGHHRSTL